MPNTKEILKKYGAKIEEAIDTDADSFRASAEYRQFKEEMLPNVTRYERLAQSLGSIIKLRIAEKDRAALQKQLDDAHIDVTPSQALALALVSLLGMIVITLLASTAIYFITNTIPALFFFLGVIAALFVFSYVKMLPQRLATAWRLKASAQMVPAILYVVVYMKHTSNLERAISFAAEHLEGPLALDFKKVFYDVEITRFSTIKQSLDSYLERWRFDAPEFTEAMHLIESSLYEPSEAQRVSILEKALQVILEGVYEKMLKYSREIRSPLTNIYMLGIILPTLALALLPLASTLLGGLIRWYHVVLMFNIIVPFFVWYLTTSVLLKRPGGHGESSVLELNPLYPTYIDRKPWFSSLWILLPLLFLGLLPWIFQLTPLTEALGLQNDYTFGELGLPFLDDLKVFGFTEGDNGRKIGPFGPLAMLLSLCIPLGFGLYFSRVYALKTKSLITAREDTKQLEEEFTTSLFQLSNRLGDGIPAEIAFAKVAQSTQGQKTQSFFALVNQNIQQLGMSLESAIFDKKRGAIIFYPSALIATSMRILTESVKKGLQVAARSLMSISEYVKNIQKINQRLRDLLAEIVSDMKSNMTFLAPLLAGIVVGLAAMIATILTKLESLQTLASSSDAGLGSLSTIGGIFQVKEMIPPYFLQVTIGIYILEIIFILTTALVTVDAGRDQLKEKYERARYLKAGILLYISTALAAILALTILAAVALQGIS